MVHLEGQRRSEDVFQEAKGGSIVGIINMLFQSGLVSMLEKILKHLTVSLLSGFMRA